MELHELVSKLKELAHELGKTPTLREFVGSGVSKRQVQKYKFNRIVEAAGLEVNQSSHTYSPLEIRPPKILVFDVELSTMLVEVYDLKVDYIHHSNIVEGWTFYSYAAKFIGHDEIYYMDQRYSSDVKDDRQLIEGLHYLLSEADYIVGHNIDRFDIKKFNTRAEFFGLEPLHDVVTFDTLKMAKKRYHLPSYSLDYLCKFFDLNNKKSGHSKFLGKTLWDECKKGNLEAWEECEDYNKKDVLATEELFLKLAKGDSKVNFQSNQLKPVCICGSIEFRKDGQRYSKNGAFQRYRCRKCGKAFRGRENLIDKDLRKGFYQ